MGTLSVWFSLISTVLSLFNRLLGWAERRGLINEGQQLALLKQLQESERALQKAIIARDDVRARLDRDGFLPDDFRDD